MNTTYQVLVKGLKAGQSLEVVAEQLAPLFKISIDEVKQLLNQRNLVVKKGIDFHGAVKYVETLENCGCACEVKPEDTHLAEGVVAAANTARSDRAQNVKSIQTSSIPTVQEPAASTRNNKNPPLTNKTPRSKLFLIGGAVMLAIVAAVAGYKTLANKDPALIDTAQQQAQSNAEQHASKSTEEGEVFFNGRGQVLVSGNPNKKVLQCVQDRAEKEKEYSEGWDDRIIAECDKLKPQRVRHVEPTIDHTADVLIKALSQKPGEYERIGSSEDAIMSYTKAGYINKKPGNRVDYSDYHILNKPAQFLGHTIVAIEHEYMQEDIGCCVSPGMAVTVRVSLSGDDLDAFAAKNGCNVSKEIDTKIGLPEAPKGTYATLNCKEGDLKEGAPTTTINKPESQNKVVTKPAPEPKKPSGHTSNHSPQCAAYFARLDVSSAPIHLRQMQANAAGCGEYIPN